MAYQLPYFSDASLGVSEAGWTARDYALGAALGGWMATTRPSHPHRSVRRSVAANPALPMDVLEALIGDSQHEVARATAHNPRLVEHVVEGLLASPEPATRYGMLNVIDSRAFRPQSPGAFMARGGWLERLAEDADHRVRRLAQEKLRYRVLFGAG